MYRYSPIRNQRSKGIKTKHVVQLCLLVAVCFWLIFQVKRSHDKKKEFDANISLNTRAAAAADHEAVKFGRKDLQPKLEETTTRIETHKDAQEDEDEQDENKHEDEDKIEEEKDDGGGGGDDEIDEKSNVEIDRDEVDIIDEDKETEEGEEKETEEKDGQSQTDENTVEQEKSNMEFDRDEVAIVDEDRVNEESEEKDGQSQTENTVSQEKSNTEIDREEVDIVDEDDKATEEKDGQSQTDENKVEQEKSNIEIDHDEVDIVDEDKTTEESEGKDGQSQSENRVEDGSIEHTHEAREEHYKADDASSAVLTHDPENEIKNGTLSDGSSDDVGLVENRSSPNTTTTYVTETTPNLTQMLNAEENTSDKSRHDNE